MLEDGEEWSLTSVYGPQGNHDKEEFIKELKAIRPNMTEKWLVTGDFNMIYKAQDKNNTCLNRRLMGLFRQAIDELQLIELNLHGRKFTWTNAQGNPTMTRIDRVFCSEDWEERFPTSHLQAVPSTLSDHCPMILQGDTNLPRHKSFRFEAYWVHMPGFQDTVAQAWNKPLRENDAMRRIHIKLARTAKALKLWQKNSIGNIKMQLAIAKEIIWKLDVAEETRGLLPHENECRQRIKLKHQGLLAIEKVKAKQRSRLTNIKAAHGNTKLFYIRANARRRKKHIQALQTDTGFVVAHRDKERIIHNHFSQQMGARINRSHTLNWEELVQDQFDFDELERDISEDEVKDVIMRIPNDKAPGPDGYIGLFFKSCWSIIRADLCHVFHQLLQLRGTMFNLLNSANVILIPKKERSMKVGDYRLISLIHSIAKIF